MHVQEESKFAVDSRMQMESTGEEMMSDKSGTEGVGSLFHNTRDLNDMGVET